MSDLQPDHCLVPGCDERPFPGDDMCLTHQREELASHERIIGADYFCVCAMCNRKRAEIAAQFREVFRRKL